MADCTKDQEHHEEAEQLAKLTRAEQRQIVAMHWSVAADKEVSAENRREARARAKALEKLLRLKTKKKRP